MAHTKLTPPPGLIGDDTSYASEGAYRSADKVRFREGRAETIGGWERVITTPLSGLCRNALPWTDLNAALLIAFGTHTNLQVFTGGQLFDITPVGLPAGAIDGAGGQGYGTGAYGLGGYSNPSTADYFPRTWSLSSYGANLIANPRLGAIYLWQNNTATPAAVLANSPASVVSMLVNNQRQVMAFGCTPQDGSAFDPLTIRWSDVAGGINTWIPATNNNAGETRLTGGGRIVKALMMGDYVLVWTSEGLHLGTYTGNPAALWTFEKQGQHGALIAPNAAVVVGQTAYWISPAGQFYVYELGGEPTILPCPIRDDFVNNIATVQQDKIIAASVSKFDEVWWFYPDGRDGSECSRAISANMSSVTALNPSPVWSRAKLARTAFVDADPSQYPVGVDSAGSPYWHEKGQTSDGGFISYDLQTADQELGEDQIMMVRGFWPDFQNQVGAVAVNVIMRMYPQGPETTYGPYMCLPGTQKIDMRASGRLARVEYSSNAGPGGWRLGAPAFDTAPAGAR